MANFDFITIGSITRDIMYYTNGGTLTQLKQGKSLAFKLGAKFEIQEAFFNSGGGASNVAVALSRLKYKVGVIASIGDDGFGVNITKNLKKEKVDTKLIQTIKSKKTGLSIIINSNLDRRYLLFACRGANNSLTFSAKKYKNLNTKWIYLNSLNFKGWNQIINEVIKYKKEHYETKIYWNPGKWQIESGNKKLHKILSIVEVLQINRAEATCLIESSHSVKCKNKNIKTVIKTLHNLGPKIIVITDGRKGSYCYDGKDFYQEDASDDLPVDTTGAGDSFGSGFVGGLQLFKGDIKRALKIAVANSGSVVSKRGSQNGLLNRKDIIKL